MSTQHLNPLHVFEKLYCMKSSLLLTVEGEKGKCRLSQCPAHLGHEHVPKGPQSMLPPQAWGWELVIERWRESTDSLLLRVAAHPVPRSGRNSGVHGVFAGLVLCPDFDSYGLALKIP